MRYMIARPPDWELPAQSGATDRLPLKIYRTFGRVEKLTSQSSRVWSSIHIRQT
jgi:hypothetical protein